MFSKNDFVFKSLDSTLYVHIAKHELMILSLVWSCRDQIQIDYIYREKLESKAIL